MRPIEIVNEPKIQLYAHYNALQPTVTETKPMGRESLIENGYLYDFKIRYDGKIMDGNNRYWALKKLTLAPCSILNWIPIDLHYFTGMAPKYTPNKHLRPPPYSCRLKRSDLTEGYEGLRWIPERMYRERSISQENKVVNIVRKMMK